MRVLITAEPMFFVPLEQNAAMLQGFAAWRERYRSVIEVFEFYAGGGGGYGILNVTDEAMLNQIMLEWPFSPFSKVVCRPTVNGDTALAQWTALLQMMGGKS